MPRMSIGTVKTLPNGCHKADITINGKRRSKTFDPKKKTYAYAWLTKQKEDAAKTVIGVAVEASDITFCALAERFVKAKSQPPAIDGQKVRARRRAWSDGNLRYYQTNLDNPILPEFGSMIASNITPTHINKFLDRRAQEGMSPRTLNIYRQIIGAIFRWAVDQEIVTRNPVKKVEGFDDDAEEAEAVVLRLHELQGVLRHAKPRARAVFRFMALTGLRRGETFRAKWDWLDLEGGWLTVKKPKVKKSFRRIPLAPSLLEELRREHEERKVTYSGPYIFSLTGRPRDLRRALASALKRAKVTTEGVSYHSFRKTYLTMIEEIPGTRYSVVKHLGRHAVAKKDVTARYLAPRDEDLKKAIQSLDDQVSVDMGVAPLAAVG